MGVLISKARMKVVILIIALTAGLGQALECYTCNDAESCKTIPGGSFPKTTCDAGTTYCEIHNVEGETIKRDCSSETSISPEYKEVEGDSHKQCRLSRGEKERKCLCDRDLCNKDHLAQRDDTISSSATTLALSAISTFFIALII